MVCHGPASPGLLAMVKRTFTPSPRCPLQTHITFCLPFVEQQGEQQDESLD